MDNRDQERGSRGEGKESYGSSQTEVVSDEIFAVKEPSSGALLFAHNTLIENISPFVFLPLFTIPCS
jgi:hypothetical protein